MPEDYKIIKVGHPAADYTGPLWAVSEGKRAGSKVFVTEYQYVLNADVTGGDGDPVFLGEGGKFAEGGTRSVGSIVGCDHPEKGPMVLLAPGQCGASPDSELWSIVLGIADHLGILAFDGEANEDVTAPSTEDAPLDVVDVVVADTVEPAPEPEVADAAEAAPPTAPKRRRARKK